MTNISANLIANLTKNFIFYIPSSMYAMVENSEFKGIIPKEDYNKIIYYEDQLKIRTTNLDQIILLDILNKKDILENNLVMLLEAKTALNLTAFEIVLKDYKKHIDCHLQMNLWMYNNLTISIPTIEDVIINAFKFQSENFKEHCSQIEHHFQIQNQDLKLDDDVVVKNLETIFSENDLKNNMFKDIHNSKSEANTKSTKKKKPIISDQDIDRFLLQTVFNVEL